MAPITKTELVAIAAAHPEYGSIFGPPELDGFNYLAGEGHLADVAGYDGCTENAARIDNWIVWTDENGGQEIEEYETVAAAEDAIENAYPDTDEMEG